MEIQEIHRKIQGYLKKGWEIEEGDENCFLYWLINPRGSIFRDRYLELNICNFCDDYPCMHEFHSEELIKEESDAKEFLGLLQMLPCYSPVLLDVRLNKEYYFKE